MKKEDKETIENLEFGLQDKALKSDLERVAAHAKRTKECEQLLKQELCASNKRVVIYESKQFRIYELNDKLKVCEKCESYRDVGGYNQCLEQK